MSEHVFRGVRRHKDGGWVANIGHMGKHVYLGVFRDFDKAKEARIEAEIKFFGSAFDRSQIVVDGDVSRIPLRSRNGVLKGWAIVDAYDFDRVAGIAWTIDPRGYVVGRPSGLRRSITLHRWLLFGDATGGDDVDHIDRDRLNNRRANLRHCTQAENSRNTKLGKNNTSGAKGVSNTPTGRWRARITVDRREIRIGTFDTVEEAGAAYDAIARKLHGEFASPNCAAPHVAVAVVAIEAEAA